MLRPRPGRTFHQRASTCEPTRVRPALGRRAPRPSRAAGRCATYAGPRHRVTIREINQPQRAPACSLPCHWLHELTGRVGTRVGRLLAIARRELAAALVAVPER